MSTTTNEQDGFDPNTPEWGVRYRRGLRKGEPLVAEVLWNGSEREVAMTWHEARTWRNLAERKGLRVKIERL